MKYLQIHALFICETDDEVKQIEAAYTRNATKLMAQGVPSIMTVSYDGPE